MYLDELERKGNQEERTRAFLYLRLTLGERPQGKETMATKHSSN